MRRFFVPPENLQLDPVPLTEEIVHHLGAVLRLQVGEEIILLDGQGRLCRCRLDFLDRRAGTARVLECRQETESALPVRLLQGLPKGDKMDLVLQKGTELGLAAFTPVLAERSIPALSADRGEKRRQRWERIIREAAQQSRRAHLPRLGAVLPLTAALQECDEELRLLLWEEESRPLAAVLPAAAPRDVAVMVGPEGGFSAAEVAVARRAGFVPVSLGPRILRSETAGLAMAAVLQYLYGDLGSGRTGGDWTA
jgi:16S rRNA (uracil1498-N3)-methyltransferase